MAFRKSAMEDIRLAIGAGHGAKLPELFEELQPFDQATILQSLEPHQRQFAYANLPDEILAAVLQELDLDQQQEFLDELGLERASRIVNEMSTDDAADLLAELHKDKVEELLKRLDEEEAEELRELLAYPEHSAGGIMTTEFFSFEDSLTAAEVMERLRREAPEAETIYYLYVTDAQQRLEGVLSLRELILADPSEPLVNIINTKVVAVPAEMDQEQVARVIQDYDFLAVPVVDKEGRLIGIVTVDDVLDVLNAEATEDITRFGGIVGDVSELDDLDVGPLRAAQKRLPWLVLLLFVGMISGNIIAMFSTTLEAVVALAMFMPVIAGMAGNTGTQALAVVVRGLALGKFRGNDVFRLIKREAEVGVIIGAVNGVAIALIAAMWQKSVALGFVIGFSLWLTLIVSTLAGTIIPLTLNRLRVDPAVASGPFITTLNDVLSLTIYFTMASRFIGYLT